MSEQKTSNPKPPVRRRINFSWQHYQSANSFVAQLTDMEVAVSLSTTEQAIRHQAYASGAVLSSVAFLEASINEFIPDDGSINMFPTDAVSDEVAEALADIWPFVEKKPVLEKCQIVLGVANRGMMETDRQPYQDAKLLVRLRNALVHFKPEWHDVLDAHLKIERNLRGKFVLNPFADKTDLFFPKKCLGHGCAEWSVKTAVAFIAEFYRRMRTEFLLDDLQVRG